MKSMKKLLFIMISMCCLSIFMIKPIYASNLSNTTNNILDVELDKAKLLHDQLRTLAQDTIVAILNKKDMSLITNRLNVTHTHIENIIEETNNLQESALEGSIEKRNIDLFEIVLEHLLAACDELLFLTKANNSIDQYNALERYFYSINMEQQSLNWLKQSIK